MLRGQNEVWLNETSLVIVEVSDEDVGQHLQHVVKMRTREGMLQIERSVVLVRSYAVHHPHFLHNYCLSQSLDVHLGLIKHCIL